MIGDLLRFTAGVLVGYKLRASLTLLAMMIGVAAVVVLTGLGEGARLYVVDQFTALGTHLLIILPGRSETVGAAPPLLGETPGISPSRMPSAWSEAPRYDAWHLSSWARRRSRTEGASAR